MTMPTLMLFAIQVATLAYAVLGGIFLAFSDFIMRALDRTDGPGGAAAMQSINREVFRFLFIPLFLAMVPGSVLLGAGAIWTMDRPAAVLAAAAIYLIGAFGVTVVCNVPMNQALAALDPWSEDAADYWSDVYLPHWTRWNTVRAVACLGAAALLVLSLGATRLA